ncbi:MAG: virulence RhuM family protein [Chlorobi bacterium]|nr:virulence RhuM family protein [Chlorobiota bacterium]
MSGEKNNSQIIIYQTESGETKIDVRFQNETVWLTQKMMAELFQTTSQNITLHLKNIYEEKELEEKATCKDFLQVQTEGTRNVKRKQKFYNLDAIISVGYRIKSHVATKFRQWATQRIREYIVKGFVLDDERLKNPDLPFDYFEELLRRIQEIRTSEKRFYRKITDIYATSVDYDPTMEISVNFFKTVQNKLHWAVTGKTAAEIINERADGAKPNMGLTNWRGDKIKKADVGIAKNYLNEKELRALNNLVEQYLIFAEGQAMRRTPMYMKDWIKKLDGFLTLNDRDILNDAGKISHELAKQNAELEFEKFKEIEREKLSQSEIYFDEALRKIPNKKNKTKEE